MEIKLLISYFVISITYSLCRLHYLLTQKTDEEFNSMLKELMDLSGTDDVVKHLVIMQILFAPVTAPFSMLKQLYRLFKKLFVKN